MEEISRPEILSLRDQFKNLYFLKEREAICFYHGRREVDRDKGAGREREREGGDERAGYT
jgi:hypothetical protein